MELTGKQLAERRAAFARIEAGWEKQWRRPSAEEIENWVETGRERLEPAGDLRRDNGTDGTHGAGKGY